MSLGRNESARALPAWRDHQAKPAGDDCETILEAA